jgi:hypothetical protein
MAPHTHHLNVVVVSLDQALYLQGVVGIAQYQPEILCSSRAITQRPEMLCPSNDLLAFRLAVSTLS